MTISLAQGVHSLLPSGPACRKSQGVNRTYSTLDAPTRYCSEERSLAIWLAKNSLSRGTCAVDESRLRDGKRSCAPTADLGHPNRHELGEAVK